jgi:hypothetical protein
MSRYRNRCQDVSLPGPTARDESIASSGATPLQPEERNGRIADNLNTEFKNLRACGSG